MGWSEELMFILSGDAVGVPQFNMFRSSAKVVPSGAGPFLSIIETGGTTPDNTHNSVIVPAYQKPGAQIVVRADAYPVAFAMARAAYNSLVKIRNEYIGSGELSATGTWYRKIRPLQEPFDLGLSADDKRVRVAFNVLGDKRPS
jgi:hypothetical protein